MSTRKVSLSLHTQYWLPSPSIITFYYLLSLFSTLSGYQWSITIGLLLAACTNKGTEGRDNASSYRVPISIQFVLAAIMCIGKVSSDKRIDLWIRTSRTFFTRLTSSAFSIPLFDFLFLQTTLLTRCVVFCYDSFLSDFYRSDDAFSPFSSLMNRISKVFRQERSTRKGSRCSCSPQFFIPRFSLGSFWTCRHSNQLGSRVISRIRYLPRLFQARREKEPSKNSYWYGSSSLATTHWYQLHLLLRNCILPIYLVSVAWRESPRI